MISYQDFEKVDIRLGTIIEVNDFPKAKKKAWQLKIDFGDLGVKNSSAQITELYAKEELLHKQVMAVVNLPVKQIANFFSECLVLGFSDTQNRIVLAKADRKVENGRRLK